ncbi:MAG: hypothetical protein Q7S22_02025 [Candidatus Micrarchaeota archaeon]|nr:hypothetical protein [Candidatus Micrarchaeota archaeon]
MKKPVLGNKSFSRCVGRTFDLLEANGLAKQFEAQGYETHIMENTQGVMTIYEIWASKKAEGLSAGQKNADKS